MNDYLLLEVIVDIIVRAPAQAAHDCPDVVHGPLAQRMQQRRCANRIRRRAVHCCEELRRLVARIRGAIAAPEEHVRHLATLVDELVSYGLPPSNRQLREMLLPIIDRVLELPDAPMGFRLFLRELGRFRARRAPRPEATARLTQTHRKNRKCKILSATGPAVTARMAPKVQAAARLLGGGSILLIGGHRRPEAERDLQVAFGLHELIWLETREHQSIYDFEPFVARRDVAVVALLIRWSSHAFRHVRALCERHAKLLIRLPRGYSVNQIATQIMDQCSERLIGQWPGPD